MTVQNLGGPKATEEAATAVINALSTYSSAKPDAVEIEVDGIVATGTFDSALQAKAKEKSSALRFTVELKYPGTTSTKFVVQVALGTK